MKTLEELMKQEQYDDAWRALLEQARVGTDYTEFLGLCRWRTRLESRRPRPGALKTVKIALLGGATTEMLEAPLALAVEAVGLGCQIHRSDYNTFAQEMLEASSATAAFGPEVAVLVTTPANIPSWPAPGDSLERVQQVVEEVCDYWLGLCARLHERTRSEIVLNNFHALPTRPLGAAGAKLPWDQNNFLRRVNGRLGERAPGYLHINDVEALSARYGLAQWLDLRYWYHAKQPVSFQCLVPYVRNTAGIIGALFGLTAKCVVVDLDNTLWGGVVGDDGPEGIVIGEGDALGEAFKAFQEYLLRLKQRGVLLAVSSKNEEANALAPFRKRPEMVLKREDFVAFKANWRPKPQNLREIAAELNIGTNALVFMDDNPAERAHVRQELPEVKVIELSDDPSEYPLLLDSAGVFETTAVSAEDRERSLQYQTNTQREELRGAAGDYGQYLASLEQRGVIAPFEERYLDRITQLVNKSNQFNLTTLRLTRSQVEERMRDSVGATVYVRLADRFGDNGLISVVSARRDGEALAIDEWLMSCRVLNRGVEQIVCNYLVGQARAMGVKALEGVYIPTAKNGLVRDHYKGLGFALVEEAANGQTRWRLEVEGYRPFEVAIRAVEDY